MGRLPKPLELRQLEAKGTGRDAGHRKPPQPDPDAGNLARKERVPPIPSDLKLLSTGRKKWREIWSDGWWLHDDDGYFVSIICRNYDRLDLFQQDIERDGFTVPSYMGKSMVDHPLLSLQLKIERAIAADLASLGFGVTARARLAIGQIKQASALADLQTKTRSNATAPPHTVETEGWAMPGEPEDTVDAEFTEEAA